MPVKHIDDSFRQSVQRIAVCSPPPYEIIIVIDGKSDQPPPEIGINNIQIVHLEESAGPAAARNKGAQIATGEILLFVDSDVILPINIVSQINNAFKNYLHPIAVFGSYDENPVEQNTISQYKNLFHFYTHQNSQPDAFTFWTGCGGILRSYFVELGGFSDKYNCPSIEDIELGYRIKKEGHSILLDKTIQVKHLKRWSFFSLITTDFYYRAIPWSRLIMLHGTMNNDMNINLSNRLSVLLSWMTVFFIFCSFLNKYFIVAVFFTLSMLLYTNKDLLLFFLRKKGMFFMLQALVLQYIYYIISGAAFMLVGLQFYLGKILRLPAHEGAMKN